MQGDRPDPATLLALADRVEAGEEGREINNAIALATGWHRVEPRFRGNKAGGWIAPWDFRGVNRDGSPRLSDYGTPIHQITPNVSGSLDAIEAARVRLLCRGRRRHGWDGSGESARQSSGPPGIAEAGQRAAPPPSATPAYRPCCGRMRRS